MTEQTILGGLDPELIDRVVTRRDALRQTGQRAGLLALASMPVAFGLMAKKAFAQGGLPADIADVLNFALTLEYLESEFYTLGLAPGAVDVGVARPIFDQISLHEAAHVLLLQQILGPLAILKPTFDFTAGGVFNDVFSNATTFITLAQAFEDTGVRAYKGQAGAVQSQAEVLTTALRIHSVEARHAAVVRRLAQSPGVKGWITGNDSAPAALQPSYLGEEATTQLGIDLLGLGFSATAASEAFDEPLTREEVEAIVTPFIVPEPPPV